MNEIISEKEAKELDKAIKQVGIPYFVAAEIIKIIIEEHIITKDGKWIKAKDSV